MTMTLNERQKHQDELVKDHLWRSENASATARRLSLAVVGMVWGLLVLKVGDGVTARDWQQITLLVSGTLAILSLWFDWFQGIMSYISVNRDLARVCQIEYDADSHKPYGVSLFYRLSDWSFAAKQILALVSAATLLTAIAPSLIGR